VRMTWISPDNAGIAVWFTVGVFASGSDCTLSLYVFGWPSGTGPDGEGDTVDFALDRSINIEGRFKGNPRKNAAVMKCL
jgi:hypothetical protein